MFSIRRHTACGLRVANWILLLCIFDGLSAVATEPTATKIAAAEARKPRFAHLSTKPALRRSQETSDNSPQFRKIRPQGGRFRWTDPRFAHLTTNDGLSQNAVTTILQDRRGFMWFATRDGLNRYDGNAFVVYKNKADDPESLSSNLIHDLMEDDQGYLWIATYTGGVSKFDPATERFRRYRHDPSNPNSLIADSVNSIVRDRRGFLWFGTEASGLDRFDPATGTSLHE